MRDQPRRRDRKRRREEGQDEEGLAQEQGQAEEEEATANYLNKDTAGAMIQIRERRGKRARKE